jgi:uncharacterized membrane protein
MNNLMIALRTGLRVILSLLFLAAGTLHFLRPAPFVLIVPPYLPYPLTLVYVSGGCEILGGCGVLLPYLRRSAGWGLLLLLVAVFPANLHMALANVQIEGLPMPQWLVWLRLPFQLILMAGVYWCILSGPVDKPSQAA